MGEGASQWSERIFRYLFIFTTSQASKDSHLDIMVTVPMGEALGGLFKPDRQVSLPIRPSAKVATGVGQGQIDFNSTLVFFVSILFVD